MSAINRLDKIQARADAATPGPWEIDNDYDIMGRGPGLSPDPELDPVIGHLERDEDDEFVTAARTDVPALVAALRAVLAACNTYEATQGIYRIEMGQREIIRVVRAEIEAALKEGNQP